MRNRRGMSTGLLLQIVCVNITADHPNVIFIKQLIKAPSLLQEQQAHKVG